MEENIGILAVCVVRRWPKSEVPRFWSGSQVCFTARKQSVRGSLGGERRRERFYASFPTVC